MQKEFETTIKLEHVMPMPTALNDTSTAVAVVTIKAKMIVGAVDAEIAAKHALNITMNAYNLDSKAVELTAINVKPHEG